MSRRSWHVALGWAAAGVALRLGVILARGAHHDLELYESDLLADNLLAGKGFVYPFFGPEVPSSYASVPYVLLVAACRAVFAPGNLALLIVQAVLGGLVVLPVHRLTLRLLGPTTGWLAAAGAALYPVHVYYAGRGQQVVLDMLLLATFVASLYACTDGWRPRIAVGGGLVGGILLASRAQLAGFALVALGWAAWRGRAAPGARRSLLLLAAALGLAVAPSLARHSWVHGRPVLAKSTGWYDFWIGNNPHATGAVVDAAGRPMADNLPPEVRAELAALPTEIERAYVFRRLALEHLAEDPGHLVRLIPARLAFLWWWDPYLATSFATLRELVYAPFLALVLGGAWRARRRWPELGPLLGAAAYISASYAFFYATGRFRYLVEPLLMPLAAHGLDGVRQLWLARVRAVR